MRNEVMHANPAISFLLKNIAQTKYYAKKIIKIAIKVYFAKIAAQVDKS